MVVSVHLLSYIRDSQFLYVFGWFTVIYIVSKVAHWLFSFFVVHFTQSTIDWTKYGDWALVTGSTDGIGKCIAKELAQKGKNIFLVSRNYEKLKLVAKEIETDFKVDTKILAFDFCNFDHESIASPYDLIDDAIKGVEIGIVVNNVGMQGKHKYFTKGYSSHEEHWNYSTNIVHCNSSSRAKLMQLVLPGMINRKKGLIINVSSLSACKVFPVISLYCGTKRFDDTLTIALQSEYKKHGITIQSITPGMVQTNMTIKGLPQTKGTWRFPTSTHFVSHMMMTIGKSGIVNGYWGHAIMRAIYSLIPESTLARIVKNKFKNAGV